MRLHFCILCVRVRVRVWLRDFMTVVMVVVVVAVVTCVRVWVSFDKSSSNWAKTFPVGGWKRPVDHQGFKWRRVKKIISTSPKLRGAQH